MYGNFDRAFYEGKIMSHTFFSGMASVCCLPWQNNDAASRYKNHIFSFASSSQRLVVKPDQLFKGRGKMGLIKVNTDLAGVKKWISERMGLEVKVWEQGDNE